MYTALMFHQCRKDYPKFLYHRFTYEQKDSSLHLSYHYEIESLSDFTSKFEVPLPQGFNEDLSHYESLYFSLGLIEALSYWKATCAPEFIIPCGTIGVEAISFWQKLFYLGLGEFRYTNQIEVDEESFVNFQLTADKEPYVLPETELSGNLIPIGGGKDSITTIEILREQKNENHLFLFNPRPACIRTAKVAGYHADQILTVKRSLDQRLIKLNGEGFLNGHTPFSALLAFTALLSATLYKKKFIVLSNEESASEENVAGTDINHQYSKSLHFEELFRHYVKEHLGSNIEYFSLLRPVNELQIGEIFSRHPKYFEIFRSCNVGCYTDSWCGSCPKCLFTYLALSPFIANSELNKIFGKNLLEDTSLHQTLNGLYHEDEVKPFECVGTKAEVRAVLHHYLKETNGHTPSLLSELLNQEELLKSYQVSDFLTSWEDRHFIPDTHLSLLKDTLQAGGQGAS